LSQLRPLSAKDIDSSLAQWDAASRGSLRARSRVFGGQCVAAATLDKDHAIVHLNDSQELSYGELNATLSDRVRALAVEMADATFDSHLSNHAISSVIPQSKRIISSAT
jgi:ketopantoate reductase